MASSKLIDGVENLIPRVLRHETNKRVQTDDRLLIEMVQNGRREVIGMMTVIWCRMNVRS
jgi:hypothetical protein